MKIRWFLLLLIAVLITACSAPAPASDPAAQDAVAATQPPVNREPNPLNVTVTTDSGLAASAMISTAGGSLSAQAADGTQFTLTFPEGALQSDETITLTPLFGVEGLPFSGGLVGGVQMAPEGLRLFQPATLTIESPNSVAVQGFETVAFAYHEDGQGVYLNPSAVAGSTMTLEIWHFSGVAAAQATTAEIQTQQQQNVPSNAEDAFTQGIQELEGIERQAQQLGEPDPGFKDRMKDFLRQAYDNFIAPQLPIALEDCAKAPEIISKALGWARQAEFLAGDELRAQIDNVMATYEQVKEKCNQNYTGEGKFRTAGDSSGFQVVNGYEFQITFRVNADGTIAGEGVLQKVEASQGGEFAISGDNGPIDSYTFQCIDPGVASLTFPPMKVTGTVITDANGQSPDRFQLTIVGVPSATTSQFICTESLAGTTWPLDSVPDQGFFLQGVEIDAADGAQANGGDSTEMQYVTSGTTWELVIHKQANP